MSPQVTVQHVAPPTLRTVRRPTRVPRRQFAVLHDHVVFVLTARLHHVAKARVEAVVSALDEWTGFEIPILTGIYLWFKIYRERRIGSILLGGNLLFGAVLVLLIYGG